MTYGGPVTILFQAGVDLKIDFMAFSQRRSKGFRNAFEFDRKRVMVADKHQISVFGFSEINSSLADIAGTKTGQVQDDTEDMVPFHVVTYKINPPEE